MADRNMVLQLLITAKDQASTAITGIKDKIGGIGSAVSAAMAPLKTFSGLLAAAIGAGGAREVIGLADAYTRLTNSLRVATTDQASYLAALQAVTEIARRSNADLDSTAQLYSKISQSAQSLGISQQQVADVTELVGKAMQLSGADAGTAAGAILQFSQAMSSGVLRGEEFNSVMEASPRLMQALAAGLGVTVGNLRAMAEAGQLTASTVTTALLSQKTVIDDVYGKLPQTVGQAMTGLGNAATLFVGKLNEQTGGIQALGSGLKFLAENMDAVAAIAGGAAAAAIVKYTTAIGQQVQAAALARAAARDQAIAAAQEREAAIAAAQGHIAAAQAAYNHALAEQRAALALQETIVQTFGAVHGEEALTAARVQAASAAQAVTAATQRYATAQAELTAAQGAAAASAGLFSRALGFLTGPGGLILLAVGAMASLYAAFASQSKVSDELADATDRYSESLRKLNEAQLNARVLALSDAIKEQERTVADAAAAVAKYRDGQLTLWDVLATTKTGTEQLTAAEGQQADATAKLDALKKNLEATLAALTGQQQKTLDLGNQELTQAGQQAVIMERLNQAIDQRRKALNDVAKAQEAALQAQIATAEAEGRAYDAAKLAEELAARRIETARNVAALAQGEATAENLRATALERVAAAHRNNNPQEVEAARLARESATLKQNEAAAAADLVLQLEAERTSLKALTAQQLAKRNTDLQALDDSIQLLAASKAEAEQARDLALAKGQEWEARQQIIAIANIEARIAQLSAERKRIEAQAAIAVVTAIQEEIKERQAQGEAISAVETAKLKAATTAMQTAAIEAEAAGMVAEAEARKAAAVQMGIAAGQGKIANNDALAASEQHVAGFVEQTTESMRENAEANKEAAAAAEENEQRQKQLAAKGDFISKIINGWTQRLQALSPAAREAFDGFSAAMDVGEMSADQLAAKLEANNEQITKLSKNMTSVAGSLDALYSGIALWATKLGQRALDIEQSFLSQKIAVQTAQEALESYSESGEWTTNVQQAMVLAASDLDTRFELLDEQDLSGLRSALDSANRKLDEMRQATDDARQHLAELDAELAEAKGENKRAELLRQQLDYQQQLADIEKQRAEAQKAGNTELVGILNEQIDKLEEINRIKQRNIETDQTSADETNRTTENLNRMADAADRAQSAMQRVGATDLSALNLQLNGVINTANRLADAL